MVSAEPKTWYICASSNPEMLAWLSVLNIASSVTPEPGDLQKITAKFGYKQISIEEAKKLPIK